MHVRSEDVVEVVQHDGFVDHAANHAAGGASLGFEIIRVRLVAPLFAVGNGWKPFFDGPVADVKRRVGGRHSDS